MLQPFGGSVEYPVVIFDGDQLLEAKGRELFGSRIVVITSDTAQGRFIGQIAIPRWNDQAIQLAKQKGRLRFTPKMVRYVVYPDIYFALRALIHGQASYEQDGKAEIAHMGKVLHALEELQTIVLGLSPRNAPELEGEIIAIVDQALGWLNPNARHVRKREALEKLSAIGKLRDKLGRVNATVFLARLVAVRLRALEREEGAATIDAVYAYRRQAVQTCIQVLECHVETADQFLQKVLANWDVILLTRRIRLAHHLETSADAFATLDVLPFAATFTHAAQEFREAAQGLQTNRVAQARALLERSAVSFRLRKLRVDLEHTYLPLSRALALRRTFDGDSLHSALQAALDLLDGLDTARLRDFSKLVASAGIRKVQGHLGAGELSDAQATFQTVLKQF